VDGLIQPGDTLRMERAGALLAVEKRIGEGGQGVVHVARLNGAPFAVKWFRPGLGSDEMRTSITALIQRGRPPHPAYVWPIDLVSSGQMPGFGYVMPLLEPRFVSLAQLLNHDLQPSFRADASYSWERGAHRSETELLTRNFGIEPVFIFDPDDPSNRPVPGDRALTWWPIYPEQCRRVFTRAFTAGLHDASLNGRVTEGTWRRVLLGLHDCVCGCPACRAALFYDPEQAGQCCWNCSAPLPVPVTLKLQGSLLVLSEGAMLTSHHLNRDRDYRKACAVVEPDPASPAGWCCATSPTGPGRWFPTARSPSGWPRTSGWACGRCASISARPGGRSARAGSLAIRSR
jgi:hypothetical protein